MARLAAGAGSGDGFSLRLDCQRAGGAGVDCPRRALDQAGALDCMKKILYHCGMTETLLSDAQWARVAALLAARRGKNGRPRADDRRCLEAILHLLVTGCGFEDLPADGAARMTAWRRLRSWQETGAWPRIWQAYLCTLDAAGRKLWSSAFLRGAFVPADRGERRWAPATRRSRSRREQEAGSPPAVRA
ncbi:MAG: transposase [Geminicoccales bacterium]